MDNLVSRFNSVRCFLLCKRRFHHSALKHRRDAYVGNTAAFPRILDRNSRSSNRNRWRCFHSSLTNSILRFFTCQRRGNQPHNNSLHSPGVDIELFKTKANILQNWRAPCHSHSARRDPRSILNHGDTFKNARCPLRILRDNLCCSADVY